MIIAIDFDGVLCRNEFPSIGEPYYDSISATRQMIDMGHEVILWTSRVDKELEMAIAWCDSYGLRFCSVNDGAPSNKKEFEGKYNESPRKIYADVYIDDHNLNFSHSSILEFVETLKRRNNNEKR